MTRFAESPAWREVILSLRHHGVIAPDFAGSVAIHFSGNGTPPKYEIHEVGRIAIESGGSGSIIDPPTLRLSPLT